jgi:streptomycin 6-kinase
LARDIRIPSRLRDSISHLDGGEAWLATLPVLIADCEARWDLRAAEPFTGGGASWTAPVTRADGSEAVLKVSWPHREAREEATALRAWDGDGAVHLYAEDREHFALLLERCRPGTKLVDAALPLGDALRIAAGILSRLWRAPDDASRYEHIGVVTAEWATQVRERMLRYRPPFDSGLVELGAALLESLPANAGRDVVVHGDFNPANILAATREPWLAIDAKPMVGDPAYDAAPLVLQVDPTDDPSVLRDRFEQFGALVGEDPQRLLAWAAARGVESALWETSNERPENGRREMEEVAVLARLVGL